MKAYLLTAVLLTALTGCNDKGPGPQPPELYGSTWALSARTVATTSTTSAPTTVTMTVPLGTYSIVFPGNGTCRVATGGATLVGDCIYNGKTLAFGTLGVSPAREVTVASLSTNQLVTVEQAQTATTTTTTTETFTR